MSSRATPIAGAPTPEALARALGLHPPTPEQARIIAHPLSPLLVVAGAEPVVVGSENAARRALALAGTGMRLKAAAAQVAGELGLRPNEVYRAALELRETTA